VRPGSQSTRSRAAPQLVSVIVPVLDEQEHIGEQLAALAGQTYDGAWEVLVVDNGSTDATVERSRRWAGRVSGLRVVDASARRGLNHARNVGARAARGELLAFCDGDDVVAPGWLAALAGAALNADLVGGALEHRRLNGDDPLVWPPEPVNRGLLTGGHGYLTFVPGGNCAVWRDVALDLGWDEGYGFGSSDKEFSWRAHLAGYRVGVAPDAVIHRRLRSGVRTLLRQHFRYGLSHPALYRDFRHHGMPGPAWQQAGEAWRSVLTGLPRAVRAPSRHQRLLSAGARRLGRVVGSLRAGVLFP
jgi:glycosyltransferase involved in cell wall biosynthesis